MILCDIRSVLLLQIRAKIGMMLARDNASWHVAGNTRVMLVANNVHNLNLKYLNFNLIDLLLDLLKRKVRGQPLQLNLGELARVIHQMCAAIPQQFIHRHILSQYLAVDVTPGGYTKY